MNMKSCRSCSGQKSGGFGFLLLAGLALAFLGCPDDVMSTVTVESVTVSPVSAEVAKGGTQTFTATVTGTGNPAQTVTWTVTGGGAGTGINPTSGLLTVAADEAAVTLTVRATSTVDIGKYGEATVTVIDGSVLEPYITTAFNTNNNLYLHYSAVVYQGEWFYAQINDNNGYSYEPVVTFTWYKDGVLQNNYTHSYIEFPTSDLSAGIHYGLAVVTIDGIAFAKEFAFRVYE